KLGYRRFYFRAGMEEDLDDAEARQRLRLDVLDVIDGDRETALAADRDDGRHLFRRNAAVSPDDAHHGDVDFRENVGGHAHHRHDAENHDQQRHDDEGIRALQRQLDNPHP